MLLLILCVSIILIPIAGVYFITNLVMIEHDEPDAKPDHSLRSTTE